ncbi:MAG: hypothetical protein ABIO63_04080 [Casimicrobiaceae bacterium]
MPALDQQAQRPRDSLQRSRSTFRAKIPPWPSKASGVPEFYAAEKAAYPSTKCVAVVGDDHVILSFAQSGQARSASFSAVDTSATVESGLHPLRHPVEVDRALIVRADADRFLRVIERRRMPRFRGCKKSFTLEAPIAHRDDHTQHALWPRSKRKPCPANTCESR